MIDRPLTVERQMRGLGSIPPVVELPGMQSALLKSNDLAHPGFFDQVAAMKPDGYMVGIGAGGIFSLMRAFPHGLTPRGLVMADVNPHVVMAARVLIDELRNSRDWTTFSQSFFGASADEYRDRVAQVVLDDPSLVNGLLSYKGRRETPMEPQRMPEEGEPYGAINVRDALEESFPLLKELAQEGKMAVNLTDIADPGFISGVRNLADFTTLTNIIYLTNMLHYRYVGDSPVPFENLGRFDNPQHPAIYVSAKASQRGLLCASSGFSRLLKLHRIWL